MNVGKTLDVFYSGDNEVFGVPQSFSPSGYLHTVKLRLILSCCLAQSPQQLCGAVNPKGPLAALLCCTAASMNAVNLNSIPNETLVTLYC